MQPIAQICCDRSPRRSNFRRRVPHPSPSPFLSLFPFSVSLPFSSPCLVPEELQQATIGGDEAANRLSEFLLQQAPTDLNRIQVLEAGLARQKVSSWRFLDLSTPSEFHLLLAVEEAPADVVMQRPAPKRPRRNYLEEATRPLTGLSVRVRKAQDEKSLCISKVLYEPINREAIEELAETRAAAQLGLAQTWQSCSSGTKTRWESAAAQALFDRPGRLYTGHHNNLYKGLVQELKKLEMQDQDNSDAIDKLLERIGMFPNLPTVFDGLDKLGIDSYRARAGQDGGQNGLAQHLRCPQVLRQVQRFLCRPRGVGAVDLFLFACLLIL